MLEIWLNAGLMSFNEPSPINKEGLKVVSSNDLYQMDVTSLLLQGIKKKSFITHREVSPGPNTQK